MASSPGKHIRRIIQAKLWQYPEAALGQFCSVFHVSEKEARTFLATPGELTLPSSLVKHCSQLNTPTVIQSYRDCVAGVPLTEAAHGASGDNVVLFPGMSKKARRKVELAVANAAAKQREAEQRQRIVEELTALAKATRSGELPAILALRGRFDEWSKALAPTNLPLDTPARRDAHLVSELAQQFNYTSTSRKRIEKQLLDVRKQEATTRKALLATRRAVSAAAQEVAREQAEKRRQERDFERSLIPSWDAPKRLDITKTEYERWRDAGFIAVHGYREFYKWGKRLQFAVHLPGVLANITPENIKFWREEHALLLKEKRRKAAAEAKVTRQRNDILRQVSDEVWEETITEWSHMAPEAVPFLALAYWANYASRWAKVYDKKAIEGEGVARYTRYGHYAGRSGESAHRHKWIDAKSNWYAKKESAMRLLAKSPYAVVSFLATDGHEPDIEERVELCNDHYEDWQETRSMFDDFADFVAFNRKALRKCPHCSWRNINHTYDSALYSLELVVPTLPDVRFSLHTTYRVGQAYLPRPKTLPPCGHRENEEGYFRFGRPIAQSEEVTHSEERVSKALELWMGKVSERLSRETKPAN